MKARIRRIPLAGLALACVSFACVTLAGCQDIFNSLMGNAAPTSVSASDGEYANEIRVNWGAANPSGDTWKDYTVSDYVVSWTGPDLFSSGSGTTTSTSYSISVADANRAKEYTVTVESRLTKGAGSVSGGSASDTGFALDTETLSWPDGGANYTIAGTQTEAWYLTMLQKGFTYSFDFTPGPGTGTVEFYPYKSLDLIHPAAASASIQSWKCDDGGSGHKFFVRVTTSSAGASFRASYDPNL